MWLFHSFSLLSILTAFSCRHWCIVLIYFGLKRKLIVINVLTWHSYISIMFDSVDSILIVWVIKDYEYSKVVIYQTTVCQSISFVCFFIWFLSQINKISAIKGWVFLGWTSTKLGLIFLLKDTMQWCWWGSYHWANAPPINLLVYLFLGKKLLLKDNALKKNKS